MSTADKTAVTVVGGYLGAGKTTLVNHVLRTADARVAVLVNDFGDVNIDADLITSQDGDTMELANGCICCSLVDGLAAAMTTITNLPNKPERLVIEASGVADPASVAAYGHGPGFVLDAVVVVVDGETVRSRSADKYVGDTVRGQLDAGHIIVINKQDLLDDETNRVVTAWVTARNPEALVVGATNAEVAPEVLFGQVSPDASRGAPAPHHPHDHYHDHDHHHAHPFESWTWEGSGLLPRTRIEALMESMPDTVMRAKGLVAVEDRPDKLMLLQRVGHRWSLIAHGPMPDDVSSRLVVIGLVGAIDGGWLAEQLQ